MNVCEECGATGTQLNWIEVETGRFLWLCPECRKPHGGDGPVDLTTNVLDLVGEIERFFLSEGGRMNPIVIFRGPHAGMNQADMLTGGIRRVVDQVRAMSARLRAPLIFFAHKITIGWPAGEKAYFCIYVFHITNGPLHKIQEVAGSPPVLRRVADDLQRQIYDSLSAAGLFDNLFPNGGVLE